MPKTGMKICTICKTKKPVSEFGKRGSGLLRAECKACYNNKYRSGKTRKEKKNYDFAAWNRKHEIIESQAERNYLAYMNR